MCLFCNGSAEFDDTMGFASSERCPNTQDNCTTLRQLLKERAANERACSVNRLHAQPSARYQREAIRLFRLEALIQL
jgi:hypothetical protein